MHTHHFKRNLKKPLGQAIQGVLFAVLLSNSLPSYAQNLQQVSDYQVRSGQLTEVLSSFALQSGIALSFDASLTNGFSSQGLNGRYTVEQGFQQLLKGTQLQLVKRQDQTWTIEKIKQTVTDTTPEIVQLDPLYVAAQAQNNNISQLPAITVIAEQTGTAEDGYLVKKLKHVGPWGEKDLQETPYSMSVISSDLMDNLIASDMEQLYKINPVVQHATPATATSNVAYAVIRGFHTQTGVFDGMRLSSYSTGISLEELERVEIFNGLTGFMYGAGNVGGTTNYVLKRPTYQPLTNVTLGNYGAEQWFAHIDLGNKIDEEGSWAYRFNAVYQNGETARDNQNIEKVLISGALDWNISQDLLVQLQAAHNEYHLDSIESRFYAYANSNYAALDEWIQPLDSSKTYTPDWTYVDTETDRIGLNLTYTINDHMKFRSAYLYKKDKSQSLVTYPLYLADSGYAAGWSNLVAPSEEVAQGFYAYLDSVFKTGKIQHKLIVGFSTDTRDNNIYTTSSISAGNSPFYSSADEIMNWEKPEIFYEDHDWGNEYTSNTTSNSNIIIGDEIIFNPKWSALIGLNYTTLRSDNYNANGSKANGYKESELTPTLSILYKPVDKLTTYLTYMEGLEQGLIVDNDEALYTNAGQVLDPYLSTQYEIGAKYAFSDNLLLSSALFRIEKANYFEEINPDGTYTISTNGEQVHQGLELSLIGKLSDHLTVMAGGTFMDLSIDKASYAATEGKEPSGTANLLAKVYLEYQIPNIEGLYLTGGAYHTGSKYHDDANLRKLDSYTIYDIGARYETKIRAVPTSLNFSISNITDEDYWVTIYNLGAPRTIAFSIKSKF